MARRASAGDSEDTKDPETRASDTTTQPLLQGAAGGESAGSSSLPKGEPALVSGQESSPAEAAPKARPARPPEAAAKKGNADGDMLATWAFGG